MARDPKYDVLFEPVKLGPKTMKNRFYQTPHCCGFGTEQPGAQAHLRAVKAEGGWAVVNTEGCSIHPESDLTPMMDAQIWNELDVRNLSLMVDMAHEYGALAGIELHYGSVYCSNYRTRTVTRGVSQISGEIDPRIACYAMDKKDIRELQGFYVAAAKRARSAGFDIINVYGGEVDSICQQFLMPFFNKRTDEYGGSVENRSRFWRETLEQVREAVGEDCAITARFGIDTLDESGEGIRVDEEGVAFIELCDHLVDFWDIIVGSIVGEYWGSDAAASRLQPEGWQRLWQEKVRPYTKKPIVGVGRFTNPDTMVDMIRNGPLDIIGAARPSIADPYLPKKIEEGRLEDIRECIGCNYCLFTYYNSGGICCTQNATLGQEYRRGWHPEKFSKARNRDNDVLIVGAGPGGMECAQVLGERGMRRIHLVDAESELGGCMRWIPQLPGLGEWARIVNYRQIQLNKLKNVEFIANTRLNAQDILEYGAEIVIIATGAYWATNGLNSATHDVIPGADASQPHCLTPEQIMVEGKEVPDGRVLIYDCDGHYMATTLAEKLANEGKKITFVTSLESIAPVTVATEEAHEITRRLMELGVELVDSHAVSEIQPGCVTGFSMFDSSRQVEWEADGVVLVTQRISNDELYRELEGQDDRLTTEGIAGLYRIGDCVVPRMIGESIFDGHRLAREIDTDNPAVPLPYIREQRFLGLSDADYESMLVQRS